jgi:hypothetical protein
MRDAVNVVEGPATITVNVPVTGVDPVTSMVRGVQVTPGGNPVPEHITWTLPVKPPLGVTVMVDEPLLPAVTVAGVPVTVKLPGLVVTLIVMAVDGPEPV